MNQDNYLTTNLKHRKKDEKTLLFLIIVFIFSIGAVSFGANPLVVMETNFGNITYELYPDEAPVTVANFLDYVNSDFYDGLLFHRVIEGFMIQAGAYYTEGSTIYFKPPTYGPIINESDNGLRNVRGTISMALSANPDTATSQFFINHVNNPHLDYPNVNGYGHSVFGIVAEGMDVVDAIAQTPVFFIDPSLTHFPIPTVDIISVYEIPEPMTLSLLALGGLLIGKSKKNFRNYVL